MLCHQLFGVFTVLKPEFYFAPTVFSPDRAEFFCMRLPGKRKILHSSSIRIPEPSPGAFTYIFTGLIA